MYNNRAWPGCKIKRPMGRKDINKNIDSFCFSQYAFLFAKLYFVICLMRLITRDAMPVRIRRFLGLNFYELVVHLICEFLTRI